MLKWTKYMNFTQFLTPTYNKSNSNDHLHIEFIKTKLNVHGILCLDNHYQSFLQLLDYSVQCIMHGFAESNS